MTKLVISTYYSTNYYKDPELCWDKRYEDIRLIKSVDFSKIVIQSIRRYIDPDQIVFIDSSENDFLSEFLNIDSVKSSTKKRINGRIGIIKESNNIGHAGLNPKGRCGWSRALYHGLHYGISSGFDQIWCVESDCLIYGTPEIRPECFNASPMLMHGKRGIETNYFCCNAKVLKKHKFLVKFRENFDEHWKYQCKAEANVYRCVKDYFYNWGVYSIGARQNENKYGKCHMITSINDKEILNYIEEYNYKTDFK
jgi:hypothetical protein